MRRPPTDYERIEADPARRPGLRREELILAVTCALAEAMDRQGVTQSELAARLGKTRGYVSQVLSGSNVKLATVADMADALGCRVVVHLVRHELLDDGGAGRLRGLRHAAARRRRRPGRAGPGRRRAALSRR